MDQISWFRGMAGEMVRSFILPYSLACAAPVALLFYLLFWGVTRFQGMSFGKLLLLVVMVLLYLALVARHALSACQGVCEPDRDPEKILHFVMRSFLLTMVWFIPVQLLVWLCTGKTTLTPVLFRHPSLFPPTLSGAGFLALWTVCALMLPLSLLLATRFGTVTHCFSPESRFWLTRERHADLLPFYAALFGGLALVPALYFLPLYLFVLAFAKVLPRYADIVFNLLCILPLAASTRLIGQLCGGFVASERIADVARSGAALFTPSIVGASLLSDLVTPGELAAKSVAREVKPVMALLLTAIDDLDGQEIVPARDRLREALAASETPLRHTIELALLEVRSGERERGVELAAEAINLAAQRGFGDVSLSLFNRFHQDRTTLKLTPYTLELLGNILFNQGTLLDAAWCYHQGAVSAGDTLKAQKKLLHVAQAAEKTGKMKEAAALYEYFVKNYPGSNLLSFAREGLDRLHG
jgi:hypothetical protein